MGDGGHVDWPLALLKKKTGVRQKIFRSLHGFFLFGFKLEAAA